MESEMRGYPYETFNFDEFYKKVLVEQDKKLLPKGTRIKARYFYKLPYFEYR